VQRSEYDDPYPGIKNQEKEVMYKREKKKGRRFCHHSIGGRIG